MKQMTAFAYLLIFMIFVAPSASGAEAEDAAPGVIKGTVRNKTTDQKAMSGIEVRLFQRIEDQASEIDYTQTDETGGFVFRGINTDKNRAYHALTRYKNVAYFSLMQSFQQNNEINLDLVVFEPTDQNTDIRIKMHHVLMETLKDGLAFREIMIIENKGDKTYVGSKTAGSDRRETLRVSLPAAAIDVQFMNPTMENTEAGLIDTAAIIPGTKRILYSYLINPSNSAYKFEKDIYLNTDRFDFIFPEKGIQATSDQLEIKGPSENSEQRLFYLAGENLNQGSKIVVDLNRPKTHSYFKLIISGLVALVVAIGFALPLIKKRNHGRAENEEDFYPTEMNRSDQRRAVLQAIAELDDQFESGEINASTYHMQRAEMLTNAKELTKQLSLDAV
jgi:hypothetical protein